MLWKISGVLFPIEVSSDSSSNWTASSLAHVEPCLKALLVRPHAFVNSCVVLCTRQAHVFQEPYAMKSFREFIKNWYVLCFFIPMREICSITTIPTNIQQFTIILDRPIWSLLSSHMIFDKSVQTQMLQNIHLVSIGVEFITLSLMCEWVHHVGPVALATLLYVWSINVLSSVVAIAYDYFRQWFIRYSWRTFIRFFFYCMLQHDREYGKTNLQLIVCTGCWNKLLSDQFHVGSKCSIVQIQRSRK